MSGMIRKGEDYTVETAEQFIRRTNFTKLDALVANQIAIVAEANDIAGENGGFETVEEIPKEIINQLFAELDSVIVPTLEDDDREWFHLRDGPVHRIVELFPEQESTWAEGKISSEGISMSLYQNGNNPILADELSIPWAEVVSDNDPHSWSSFQDVEINGSKFTLEG